MDLLGFRNRVTRNGSDCNTMIHVVINYYQSRKIVEDCVGRTPRLQLACFSDTFLVCSDDDSIGAFARMEQAARFIMNFHLARHIPIRGALSCGAMYADNDTHTYIGGAFIEAYDHAENQNWIGLVLCRSATRRMAKLRLPPSRRLNYRRWPIPWNKKKKGLKPLYAYAIGAAGSTAVRNDSLETLREMMATAKTRREKNKYRASIKFLELHGFLRVVPPPPTA
jgi:hypothetical protein